MSNEFITIDNNKNLNDKLDIILKKIENIENKNDNLLNSISIINESISDISNFICNQLSKLKLLNLFPNFYHFMINDYYID